MANLPAACVFRCMLPVCTFLCVRGRNRGREKIQREKYGTDSEAEMRGRAGILRDCVGSVMHGCAWGSFCESRRLSKQRGGVCVRLQLTGTFGIVLVEVHGEIVRNLETGQKTRGLLPPQQTKHSAQRVRSNLQVDRCILLSC